VRVSDFFQRFTGQFNIHRERFHRKERS
jgi:hypothetical protein